jgi:transcriptional regulator with XRE-family HTH domain
MGEDAVSGNADELLAWNLRMLREQAGISQDALAAAMTERGHKWYQSTVYRVESGKQTVRFGEAAALAAILGTAMDRFTWASHEAMGVELVTGRARKVRESARSAADAIVVLLAALTVAERVLAQTAENPYPRVQEARRELARDMGLYGVEGAVAEGKRQFGEHKTAEEESEDDTEDLQGEPGAGNQRAEGGDREH